MDLDSPLKEKRTYHSDDVVHIKYRDMEYKSGHSTSTGDHVKKYQDHLLKVCDIPIDQLLLTAVRRCEGRSTDSRPSLSMLIDAFKKYVY